MRVVHVTKKFPPVVGGDATAVSSLCRAQARRGFDVRVLAYRAPGIEETDRVHLVGPTQTPNGLDRIGILRLWGMGAIALWAKRHLARLRPDIVHAHAADVGAPVVGVTRELGIPLVLTCHGVWFPHQPWWYPSAHLERYLLRRGYDSITSVDRTSVQAIRDAGIRDAILVPNGVEVAEFEGARPPHDAFRVLFVGRHVYQKGIDVLLEAVARARPRIGDRFVLELAGDGPERTRLEHQARDLDLEGTVRFLGQLSRPRLLEAFGRADAFVLPSRFEGFPLVILEAWAAGLPVIATSVGGVPDICDSRNAVLVPPSDPNALADAIASLASDPERRESLGTAGRSLVHAQYTWETIATQYERVYETSLSSLRSAR